MTSLAITVSVICVALVAAVPQPSHENLSNATAPQCLRNARLRESLVVRCSGVPARLAEAIYTIAAEYSVPAASVGVVAAWPASLLSIELDLLHDGELDMMLPARRIAIVRAFREQTLSGTYGASARAAPTAEELRVACAVLRLLVPWTDEAVAPCLIHHSSAPRSLFPVPDLHFGAPFAPNMLLRDGSLGTDFGGLSGRNAGSSSGGTAATASSAFSASTPLSTSRDACTPASLQWGYGAEGCAALQDMRKWQHGDGILSLVVVTASVDVRRVANRNENDDASTYISGSDGAFFGGKSSRRHRNVAPFRSMSDGVPFANGPLLELLRTRGDAWLRRNGANTSLASRKEVSGKTSLDLPIVDDGSSGAPEAEVVGIDTKLHRACGGGDDSALSHWQARSLHLSIQRRHLGNNTDDGHTLLVLVTETAVAVDKRDDATTAMDAQLPHGANASTVAQASKESAAVAPDGTQSLHLDNFPGQQRVPLVPQVQMLDSSRDAVDRCEAVDAPTIVASELFVVAPVSANENDTNIAFSAKLACSAVRFPLGANEAAHSGDLIGGSQTAFCASGVVVQRIEQHLMHGGHATNPLIAAWRESAWLLTTSRVRRTASGSAGDAAMLLKEHKDDNSKHLALLPPLPTRVCRTVEGTGFHRTLAVSAEGSWIVPPATATPRPSGMGASAYGLDIPLQPPPRCTLAVVLTVDSTTYMDLDELRAGPFATRHQVQRGSSPLLLRAFSRFIDVERPLRDSLQHKLIFGIPVQLGRHTVSSTAVGHEKFDVSDSLLPAGWIAELSVTDDSDRSGMGGPLAEKLTLQATLRLPLHTRYQAPGCGVPSSAAGGSMWLNASAGAATLLGPSAANARDHGTAPYISGCYAEVSSPVPQLYLRCSGINGGRGDTADVLRGVLRIGGHVERSAESAASVDTGWVALLQTSNGGTAREATDSRCMPRPAVMPVGDVRHASAVTAATSAIAIAGALAVIFAAVRNKPTAA